MNIRVIAAALAGGVVFFVLGFLIYGLALADYMRTSMVQYPGLMKDPPNFIALGLSNLLWGLLLAIIFDYWANIRTFAGGAIAGAIIMFVSSSAIDMQFKAFMVLIIGYMPVIVDVIAVTVMGAVAGGVVGLVLGAMNKQTAEAV